MRTTFLLLALAAAGHALARDSDARGVWGDRYGYAIVVKESRVCGTWSYIATNREYEGLFAGNLTEDGFIANRVCGTPGSFAKSFCPIGDTSGLQPSGWHTIRAPARICHGRLIFLDHGDAFPEKCLPDPTLGDGRAKGNDAKTRMTELLTEIQRNPEFAQCR